MHLSFTPSSFICSIYRTVITGVVFFCALVNPLALRGVSNPVPFINQPLVPASVLPGGPAFTLTVNGTGFVSTSVVNWNGSPRTTSFVNNSQLTASIPFSDITTAATALVTVVSLAPGGGTSNLAYFQIAKPTPSVAMAKQPDLATGVLPLSAAVGDFNGDGKLDLAVVNNNQSTVSIFLGIGDGTFQPKVDYATGQGPESVSVGDFNGDGKLDLAITNASDLSVSILLGIGNGAFQAPIPTITGFSSFEATTGDFNGDGKLDLAVTNFNDNTVTILLGKGDGTFQPHVEFATGTNPQGVTAGDFNRDGKLDLAISNESDDAVSVLLGNGDGTFQIGVPYATGFTPSAVFAADFNGDGKLDLAVINEGDDTVSILLGKGDGTFQTRVDSFTGAQPLWMVTGDFNGDGIPDVAVVNRLDGTVSVLIGKGDGTFQPRVNFAADNLATFVVVGDFNQDGRLDLAVVDPGGNAVSILLQLATPVATLSTSSLVFSPPQNVGTTSSAKTVMLTNSGSATLVISGITISGGNAGDFAISTNACGGSLLMNVSCSISVTFSPSAVGTRGSSLKITDNAFGSPQTVSLTGTGANPASFVMLAPASLTFSSQGVGSTSSAQPVTLSISSGSATISSIATSGDFGQTNNCPSMLVAGAPCTINVTFTPTKAGSRTGNLSVAFTGAPGSPQGITLTGTGFTNPLPQINQPLVPASAAPGGLAFTLTVNGTGFVSGATLKWNGSSRTTNVLGGNQLTATINTTDITTAGTASVTVFNPTPGGGVSNFIFFTVTTPNNQPVFQRSVVDSSQSPNAVITGDFNKDGFVDMAISGPSSVVIYLGNGNGTFKTGVTYAVGNSISNSLVPGDFNGDGILDIATANFDTNSVSILLGKGDGTFLTHQDFAVGPGPISLVTGDFNGDGKFDLAVADHGLGTVSILLGNGDGTFPTHIEYGTNSGPESITAGDFNGDNKLDLAVATQQGTVSVLLGNGDGTFGPKVEFITVQPSNSITTGDFNGDGKLDLAVASGAGGIHGTISVLMGNGDGSFQPHVDYSAPTRPTGIVTSDLNGDGRLDLALANIGSNTASVLLGNGDGTFQSHLDFTTVNSPGSLAVGDFSGSGRLGLAVAELGTAVSVLVQTPGISLSSTNLAFGPQMVGTTSPFQSVTVTNISTSTVTFTSIVASGDYGLASNTCGASVASGANCSISVTFTPTATGTRNGAITITDSAPGNPQLINLTGIGITPIVNLSPSFLAFASQLIGAPSGGQAVILKNTGTATLTITSLVAGGDFAQMNNCGTSVAAGASCTITITFTPTASGPRKASLIISDNAAGSPHTIILTGLGIAAGLSPTSLNFSSQSVGTSSPPQPVILSNGGGTVMNIWQMAIQGSNAGDFSKSGTCGSTLAAGTSCTINVTFTPSGIGTRSASLLVSDDGGGSPQSVKLTGAGVASPAGPAGQAGQPSLAGTLSAAAVSFGKQEVGTIAPAQTVVLTNISKATLTIRQIVVSGAAGADFAQTNTCGSGLKAGRSCVLRIRFIPRGIGSRTGMITIEGITQGTRYEVRALGIGTGPAIKLPPPRPKLVFQHRVGDEQE